MKSATTIVDAIPELVSLEGKRVLDAGSGVGGLVRALTNLGADVFGIEPNPANVDISKQNDPDRPDHYQVAGAENLPFEDGEFDLVVFSNSLHHVPVELQQAAMSESARVVKPGGNVIVAEPVPEGDHFNLSLPMEDETDVRNHALAALLDEASHGLKVEVETSFVRPTPYASFDAYHKAMIQVDPGRAQAFVDRGDQLKENFVKFARIEGDLSVFDQEIRIHLLKKPG
jgi:SAM-dependent methyltransferase